MTIYSIFGILGAVAAMLTGIRFFIRKPSSIIVSFIQNFVGVLFIFSGFIKANDPLGFGYKLEEYFDIFGMQFFIPVEAYISIFICIFEMVVGIMLLLGARMKFTLWTLMLMMVFFTFLTFYAAYSGNITDCGCFGDFMHITPWQSFGKDVVLLVFTLILVFGRKHVPPAVKMTAENILVVLGIAICSWIPFHTFTHLPFFDFRPYKVGTNMIEAMKIPPGGEGKFETIMRYKNLKTGELKDFTMQNYPWKDSLNWKHDSTITKTISEPILAPIHDFHLNTFDGSEYTEDILNAPGPKFFLVCKDIKETSKKNFGRVNDLAQLCAKDSIQFIGLTSSSQPDVDAFVKETGSKFEFYSVDGTQLKTIIRSNPGLILLDGPVVKAMWPGSALPSYNDVKEKYFKK